MISFALMYSSLPFERLSNKPASEECAERDRGPNKSEVASGWGLGRIRRCIDFILSRDRVRVRAFSYRNEKRIMR